MKEQFSTLQMEIVFFRTEDIITESPTCESFVPDQNEGDMP